MSNGDYFVMFALFNSKPVKGFKCGCNVEMYMGAVDSAGKCILNLLKAFNLHEREREKESAEKRVTVIKTSVNKGRGDSSGGSKVESVSKAAER